MLAGLRHRAVRCVHNQNRAIHLRRAGDHVLHIVGVARAVHMRIVARIRLILNMRCRNGDAAGFFLRRRVNLVIVLKLAKLLRDRRRQRRLAVVNVTNRAYVTMRFITLKLFLRHGILRLVAVGPSPDCHLRADLGVIWEKIKLMLQARIVFLSRIVAIISHLVKAAMARSI